MGHFKSISLLKNNRNFCFLYIGQFVSFSGTMITSVALPYQVYHETHSTLMVGLISLFQLMPLLITALLGGVLADRHHRKTLLLISETALAIGCLVLAFNATLATPHLSLIFVTATVMSAITGLHRPALDSIAQQIVAAEDYPALSVLSSFKFSVCLIAGPAIGGLVIAYFGLAMTFIADFSSFIVAIMSLCCMKHIPKPGGSQEGSAFSSLAEGLRYAITRQELLGTYFVDFIAMIFTMRQALFPAMAQNYGGVKTLGLLYSSVAVGGLLVTFCGNWVMRIKRHGAAVAISALLCGVAIMGLGFSTHLWEALFCLGLFGALDGISGMFRQTMWNTIIPNHYRGRLAGIEMIGYMSGPKLGDTESGLVAAWVGIAGSIVSGGVLCILGVAICAYCLPRFWRYRAA